MKTPPDATFNYRHQPLGTTCAERTILDELIAQSTMLTTATATTTMIIMMNAPLTTTLTQEMHIIATHDRGIFQAEVIAEAVAIKGIFQAEVIAEAVAIKAVLMQDNGKVVMTVFIHR
jgi:ABC-type Fe2+-enterobactin transport system substrate-binding protein